MKEKFEAKPVNLAPVLTSLSVGIICSFLLLTAPVDLYAVTPFPEGLFGSVSNGFYFVVLALVGASLMYFLLKRKKLRIVSLITGFALTSAAFLLSVVYLYAALSLFNVSYRFIVTLVLATLVTATFDFAVFRTHGTSYSLTILALGGSLGAFLGMSIPTLSAILILTFLAAYDVFAVYRGPVGKLAQAGLERLQGLSLTFRGVQMGLGDLTFYPMLTVLVLVKAGLVFCLFSAIGVLAGVFLGFKLLEKKGILPGLPLPVALGLVPLIVWLLL